jgi:hypothetical protein
MAEHEEDSRERNESDRVQATANAVTGASDPTSDPNDEVPVPIAMWPSEVDERAQIVEALRGNAPAPRTDTQIDPT